MIKKIKIQNIQSHKDTTLELNPGINAIIGSSNNGKSAILRALYWVRYNRPLGTDNLLSHWAIDRKGNQDIPMQVIVENEAGVVIRRRTKDENQYIVNDKELNVVKTDVPEEVEKLLKLSDTNIQRQQDAPFLLSLTSGQVAQYFNKTVRLNIIDKILSNAESKRRKTNQEINQVEELCEEYKQKKEKYSWLEDAGRLLVKYENISDKNNEIKAQQEQLNLQLDNYKKLIAIQNKYKTIADASKLVNKLEDLQNNSNKINEELSCLQDSLTNIQNYKIYPSFDEQSTLIEKIEKIDNQQMKKDIGLLSQKINYYRQMAYTIKGCNSNIEALKKQLPKICPLCGGIMGDKCLEEINENN